MRRVAAVAARPRLATTMLAMSPAAKQPNAELLQTEMARQCLATRVRLLSRTITRIYDAALRPFGLTISQLGMLSAVSILQPAAAGDVANYMSMDISTLSRNAHLMAGEGWITVEPSEHGNGRVLRLTGDGARKLSEATPAWSLAQAEAKELLGAEDAGAITRLVDRMWARRSESSRPSGLAAGS